MDVGVYYGKTSGKVRVAHLLEGQDKTRERSSRRREEKKVVLLQVRGRRPSLLVKKMTEDYIISSNNAEKLLEGQYESIAEDTS